MCSVFQRCKQHWITTDRLYTFSRLAAERFLVGRVARTGCIWCGVCGGPASCVFFLDRSCTVRVGFAAGEREHAPWRDLWPTCGGAVCPQRVCSTQFLDDARMTCRSVWRTRLPSADMSMQSTARGPNRLALATHSRRRHNATCNTPSGTRSAPRDAEVYVGADWVRVRHMSVRVLTERLTAAPPQSWHQSTAPKIGCA